MNAFNAGEMFSKFCKMNKQWGLCLYWTETEDGYYDTETIMKAIPYLGLEDVFEERRFFLFDTEQEARDRLKETICDHIPGSGYPFTGNTSVYAALYSPDGEVVTENT